MPVPSHQAEFVPASRFGGARRGYVFTKGARGVGYYLDNPALRAARLAASGDNANDGGNGAAPPAKRRRKGGARGSSSSSSGGGGGRRRGGGFGRAPQADQFEARDHNQYADDGSFLARQLAAQAEAALAAHENRAKREEWNTVIPEVTKVHDIYSQKAKTQFTS